MKERLEEFQDLFFLQKLAEDGEGTLILPERFSADSIKNKVGQFKQTVTAIIKPKVQEKLN